MACLLLVFYFLCPLSILLKKKIDLLTVRTRELVWNQKYSEPPTRTKPENKILDI